MKKLSVESQQATQKTTNAYTEALYILQVPQKLEKLFEKYEPIAKKLRTKEEAAEKRATGEAKKTVATERSVVAGREATGRSDFGSPRTSAYTPAASFYPKSSSTYTATKTPFQREKTVDQTGKKKPVKPTSPEGASQPSKSSIPTKTEKVKVPEQKNPESERILGKIEANVQEIAAMIEKNEKLKNINSHITGKEPVDRVLAIIEIPSLKRKISETISDVKVLNLKIQFLAPTLKKYYKNELQNIFDQYKEPLTMVSNAIQTIEKNIETDEEFKKKISDEKKYAYLEDEKAMTKTEKSVGAYIPTIKDEIPHPTSLYELKETIQDLIKAIEDFSIEKGPKAPLSDR